MAEENDHRDAYGRFAAMWADGEPIRSEHELIAAIRAAGLEGQPIPDDWLRALDRRWVYGHSDEPFESERQNRSYRRELMSS